MRVLIIEDNPLIAEGLARGLRAHGFVVDVAHLGCDGEELAAKGTHDVISLDLMLPDRDGRDLCRALRQRGVSVKILMLSALDTTAHRIEGLNSGADDYLVKPFEFDEFLARIRALLRRGDASESSHLRYEDLDLDLHARVAKRRERPVPLTARQCILLEYFMRNPHRVLTRPQICEQIWNDGIDRSANIVDVYVSALRKKIDQGFDHPLLHTCKGAGYRFGEPK